MNDLPTPDEARDNLAVLRASVDQMLGTMTELARALGQYHATLVDEGFSREEALAVCIAWQTTVLRTGSEDS